MALTSNAPEGSPAGRPRRSRRGVWLVVLVPVLVVTVPAVGFGVMYFAPSAFLGPEKDADSTGEIRTGMRPAEVAQVLAIDAPERGFVGTVTRAKDGRVVRVRFAQGRVAGVEEGSLPVPLTYSRVAAGAP